MIPIEEMLADRRKWFDGSGPRADEILSTRVRLARNVAGARFVGHARDEDLAPIYSRLVSAIRSAPALQGANLTPITDLGVLDRQFLLERHLLSHDMTAEAKYRGIAIGTDESLSVMVNEEDHLRLQCLKSGMQLVEGWDEVNQLDQELGREIPFAYSEEFGYLTSCPTNAGTGMRASVLVHLPALVLSGRIKKVLAGITQVGLAVRGFHGEGTEVVGNFFQISNQVTLGISEGATIEKLQGVVLQILEMEGRAREALLRDAPRQIEDKIGRSHGTLKYARIMSTQECMGLVSAVRFGVTIGLVNLPDLATLNEILIYSQPAHLQKIAGREMSSVDRNEYRAAWIQDRLKVRDAPRPSSGS